MLIKSDNKFKYTCCHIMGSINYPIKNGVYILVEVSI